MTADQPDGSESARQQSKSSGYDGPESRVVHSNELFDGHKQVLIHHDGEIYRLFRTRNNKLLLQK